MTEAEMIQCAIDEGFAAAAIVDTTQIVFDPSFRPYCEENLCGQYGANYSCPPDCGNPEEMQQRIQAHKKALALQTIWQVTDYSDVPAIKHAKRGHNAAEIRVVKKLREAGHYGLTVGASGCALCTPCAQTQGLPCNFRISNIPVCLPTVSSLRNWPIPATWNIIVERVCSDFSVCMHLIEALLSWCKVIQGN